MPVRARVVILAIFGSATLGLIVFAVAQGASAEFFSVAPLATAVLVFGLSLFQLRHAGLSLLVAFGPWLALPWLNAVALLWPKPLPLDPLCMAFGYAGGALLADVCARNIVATIDRLTAANAALRQLWKPLALALVALAVVLAAATLFSRVALWRAAGTSLEAAAFMIVAMGAVLLTAPLLAYPEDFISRWNRWREFQSRIFASLAAAAQPRWGWSFGGISLVLAAIAYFGVPTAVAPAEWAILALVSFAAALVQLRAWRAALAVVTALAVAVLIARRFGPMPGVAQDAIAVAIPLMAMLALAARIAPLQESGDGMAALAAAYGESAGGILFAILAAVLALAGFAVFGLRGFMPALALIVAGGAAALIAQPAFTAIYANLFPRRRSVEELYRAS